MLTIWHGGAAWQIPIEAPIPDRPLTMLQIFYAFEVYTLQLRPRGPPFEYGKVYGFCSTDDSGAIDEGAQVLGMDQNVHQWLGEPQNSGHIRFTVVDAELQGRVPYPTITRDRFHPLNQRSFEQRIRPAESAATRTHLES